MSKDMLDDNNTINDFNPYVLGEFSLPGASRQPHAFDSYPTEPVEMNTPFPDDEDSPLCSYGITAGDSTIDMCRPVTPNCPLSRPLLPGRNIDRGFTIKKKPVEKNKSLLDVNMIIIIVLMILILLLATR